MSIFHVAKRRQGDRFNRRELLHVGALGTLGLSLPRLLRAESRRQQRVAAKSETSALPAKAKSCILFFMEGGPSHIDMWDMKPKAPSQVRGIYKPIETSLPGFHVCEHLPLWAPVMHHMTIVRSVSHRIVDHNASSYYTLTGHYPKRGSQLVRGPSNDNAPPFGSVLAKLRPTEAPLPDYVHIPKRFFNCGHFIPGVLAGFLGDSYDPLITGDPSAANFRVPGLEQAVDVSNRRLARRQDLLQDVDRSLGEFSENRAVDRMDTFYQRAFSLITSQQARRAFRLDDEPEAVRRRYGLPKQIDGVRGGGLPHLGQSFLLARRLIEAGVRLVAVWAGGQAFDGHQNHFHSLTKGLCPPTNQGFSALIEDLDERGLLEETLVVAMGEFGRTPKMGQITFPGAVTTPDGRDHWPHCYTVLLAGAGVKQGLVFGASDRFGGYPTENAVSPEDIAATIYTLMGINPHARIYNRLNKPHTIAAGQPVRELLA